jgi:hypothetical protein
LAQSSVFFAIGHKYNPINFLQKGLSTGQLLIDWKRNKTAVHAGKRKQTTVASFVLHQTALFNSNRKIWYSQFNNEGAWWSYFCPWYGDFITSATYNDPTLLNTIYNSQYVISLDEVSADIYGNTQTATPTVTQQLKIPVRQQ